VWGDENGFKAGDDRRDRSKQPLSLFASVQATDGCNAAQYILQHRIERAQHLLHHSQLSIAEIANQTDFCDQSHLTRSFKRAIASNPFADTEAEPTSLHFFFLASLPEHPDLQAIERVQKDSEQFRLIDNVFYLYAPEGIGRSQLATKVETLLGVAVTARNGRTVSKLMAMVQ
jgi:hypothetical protein